MGMTKRESFECFGAGKQEKWVKVEYLSTTNTGKIRREKNNDVSRKTPER